MNEPLHIKYYKDVILECVVDFRTRFLFSLNATRWIHVSVPCIFEQLIKLKLLSIELQSD